MKLINENRTQEESGADRRTFAELFENAKIWQEQENKKRKHKAKIARQQKLEALAPKENTIWGKIETILNEENRFRL